MDDQDRKKMLDKIKEESRHEKEKEIKSIVSDVRKWEKDYKISFKEALLLELIYTIPEKNQ